LNQIGDLFNINLSQLYNDIKDLVTNYKLIFAQLLDLIKNPTVLLRLAVAKLDAFQTSEFYGKFYMLGVFIAGFYLIYLVTLPKVFTVSSKFLLIKTLSVKFPQD
jgi:hypothetical protein